MTIAASMTPLDKVLITILAAAMLIAILAYWSLRTARTGGFEDDVETALTDPAYAPYGADLDTRAAQVDDYAIRAQKHQPCTEYPCPHWRAGAVREYTPSGGTVPAQHCRCGNDWVCELAGPLNQTDHEALTADREAHRNRNRHEQGW